MSIMNPDKVKDHQMSGGGDDDCLIRISPTVIMPVITGSLLTV